MCRKPLQCSVDALAINHGIASAIRQRAATARLLNAVNHSGFQPLAASWAAKLAALPQAPRETEDGDESAACKMMPFALERSLVGVSAEAIFQAALAKAFSLGTPYDLDGAAHLFSVAAAAGHASASAHLAYLQSHGCVRSPSATTAEATAALQVVSAAADAKLRDSPGVSDSTGAGGAAFPHSPPRRIALCSDVSTSGGAVGWKDPAEFVPLFVAAANGGDPFAEARCVQVRVCGSLPLVGVWIWVWMGRLLRTRFRQRASV
jgi:hypothetical protein